MIERNNDGPSADAAFVEIGVLCARKLREGNLIVAANPTAGALKQFYNTGLKIERAL